MLKIHLMSLAILSVFLVGVCGDGIESKLRVSTFDQSVIKPTESLKYERAVHSSTKLLDGRVLIAGGMRINEEFHDTGEIFDPKTSSFKLLRRKMTKKRVSHTATLLLDGRVLITGGWSNRQAPEHSTEIFDPVTGQFSVAAPMTVRRSGHSATLLNDGRVVIAGGRDGDGILDSIEIFEPKSGEFRVLGQLKTPRKIHTATKLKNGRILFAGGEVANNQIVSTAEIFDLETGKSDVLSARMSFPRYKHDAVVLADGNVLIYGGSDARDTQGRLKAAELFDPKKEVFVRVGDLNFARFKISGSAVRLENGKVLIAGGAEQAEMFDPKKGEFSLVEGKYGNRFHFASATLLNDGRVLITGGYRFRSRASPLATNGAWIFSE